MKTNKKYSSNMLLDSILILVSVCPFFFFYRTSPEDIFVSEITWISLLFLFSFIAGFHFFKLYHRSWIFINVDEFKMITKSSILSLIIVVATYIIFDQFLGITIPILIILFIWTLILLNIIYSRLLLWFLQDNRGHINKKGKETLIIGAGDAGILVLKELKKSVNSPLYPIGFVDDDPEKLHLKPLGIPVIGRREDIHDIVKRYNIKVAIIAMPSAPGSEITKIINLCQENKIEVKIIPRISDIINGMITLNMIRKVKVEDLLGRPPIQLNLLGIASYVTNKTVLITGAGGSIGSEICRQISSFQPKKIILLGHGENSIYTIEKEIKQKYSQISIEAIIADIQDQKRIENIFSAFHPQVIFHAAAHKHVPLMEFNPTEAIKNNIFGTKVVAECAHKYQAKKFVQISTDKAVNPTSVMGVTKHIAEIVIQSLNEKSNTDFAVVRFGNVLGSRGSVIPLFQRQIREGGPVTVTHPDMTRYFMTIPEAVQLVIQAGAIAKGGEIFILDMGEPVKISDLAKNLIKLSGLTPDKDIPIHYTGIRPGEKLYEELFHNEEERIASKHELIFIAKSTDHSEIEIPVLLNKLQNLVYTSEVQGTDEIKLLLKQIVPTYQTEIKEPKDTKSS